LKEDFVLGRLLGRREAFGIVAARCSAAEAVQIREIRETKAFLNEAKDWMEFCPKFLNMSHDSANRIIRLLDEFGPRYFEMAQLTRISPKTYRAIAASIDEKGLNHNGEAIALIPENATKVAAAVAALRKTAESPEPPPAVEPDPIAALEAECNALAAKIERSIPALRERNPYFRATVCSLRDKLNRIELMI
jgi:hypothetical protein